MTLPRPALDGVCPHPESVPLSSLVMRLLVQATVNESLIIITKATIFLLGLEEETRRINLVQATGEGAEMEAYVTA